MREKTPLPHLAIKRHGSTLPDHVVMFQNPAQRLETKLKDLQV